MYKYKGFAIVKSVDGGWLLVHGKGNVRWYKTLAKAKVSANWQVAS